MALAALALTTIAFEAFDRSTPLSLMQHAALLAYACHSYRQTLTEGTYLLNALSRPRGTFMSPCREHVRRSARTSEAHQRTAFSMEIHALAYEPRCRQTAW